MKRLTSKTENKYEVKNIDEAIETLGRYEDSYEEILLEQENLSKELEILRNEGKEKSVKFREKFGKKMMNLNTIMLFERHGLK